MLFLIPILARSVGLGLSAGSSSLQSMDPKAGRCRPSAPPLAALARFTLTNQQRQPVGIQRTAEDDEEEPEGEDEREEDDGCVYESAGAASGRGDRSSSQCRQLASRKKETRTSATPL